MPGIGEHLLGRPFLHHLAGIHHDDARADAGDDAEVVADQDDGGAEIAVEFAQQFENLRLDGDVERSGRLVGDQQRRLVANAHRQHHALAHAAGELVRIAAIARSGAVMPMRPSSLIARARGLARS